jgi:NSS family neurotransmitter:Na+ symporter
VAIMEPIVATLIQQTRLGRFTATLVVGTAVWLLALLVVLSFGEDRELLWFGKRNLLGVLDYLTAGVLLPLVALLISILVGWRLRPDILRLQLSRESDLFFSLWRFLLRYIAPPAITLLMFMSIFMADRA